MYRAAVRPSLERACLAIADVSGYTGYLAGVELDHAQDILADLISTIVEAMAPFRLAKLEGDAAFTYLPGETLDGHMLQDTIEGAYVAFRSRLRNIQQASTCDCNACTRIPTLDLKFVVHHGEVAFQRMLGSEELVGADVILVHRLLKNEVVTRADVPAYALYTERALEAAGLDPAGQGLLRHVEQTDVAGEVVAWVRDLTALWQSRESQPRREIPEELLLRETVWEVPTPPAVTFDHLSSPRLRPLWDRNITSFEEEPVDGRRGVGTMNHCMHGENAIGEEILEWRPPTYWMMRGWMVVPGDPGVYLSDALEMTPTGGTRVTSRVGRLEEYSVPPEVVEQLQAQLAAEVRVANANLRKLLAQVADELAGRHGSQPPRSQGRHLAEREAD